MVLRPAPRPPTGSARTRLGALGARPGVEPPSPATRPVAGAPPSPGRVGWPGAAAGTPASRLRLPPEPVLPLDGLEEPGEGDEFDDELDEEGGPPAPARSGRGGARTGHGRPSAWSTTSVGDRVAQRWVPESLRGARLDPGRVGALALAAVAVIAAVVVGLVVWSGRPTPEPVPALPVIGAAPAPAPAGPAPTPAGPMIVSVAGKVARPGLVRLPEGSRVGEAVDAAGGALPGTDLTALNLAARVSDGEQVLVGVDPPPGAASAGAASAGSAAPAGSAPPTPGGATGGAAGGKLDLNAATLEQLDQLPGVGPVTAKKILDWRTQNGRFAAVEQLQEISGIGDARFATLRDVVTV